MRRLLPLLLSCLLLAGCSTATVNQGEGRSSVQFEPPKDYVKYSKEGVNYEIYYPKDWAIQEDSKSTTVTFLSPRESREDTSRETCSVSTVALPRPLSVDRFYDLNMKHIEQTMSGFKNHGRKITTLRGRKTVRGDFSEHSGRSTFRTYQYFLTKETTGYLIICTTTADVFAKHGETFKTIAGTFKIK